MRKAGIFASSLLILASCAPEESRYASRTLEGTRGKAIVYRSNVDGHVMAMYLEEGSLQFYGDVSEVGGPSDLGGRLEPCGEGLSKCVEFLDSIYFMVPLAGGGDWAFRGYDFHLAVDSSDREGQVVVVSRDGEERYSYSYSQRCGVEWINLSTGGERGERVYYSVGLSLFSDSVCTPAPAG